MAIKLLSSTKIGNFTLPHNDGTSGQALVTDGNGNISFAHTGSLSGLSFSSGTLTATTATGTITVNLDGRYALSGHNHSGVYDNYQSWNLKTNGVQRTTVQSGGTLDLVAGSNVTLSYGAGGVVTIAAASSTETDTLATVTARGASTSTPVTFNGNVTLGNSADLIFSDLAGTFPTSGKGFDWTLNNDGARIYAIQPASDSIDLVFQLRDNATTNDRFVFWVKEWQGAAFDKYPLIIRGGTEFDLVDSALYTRGTIRLSNTGVLQNVTGNVSMFTNDSGYITGSGSTSGNAGTATTLQTARTINGTSFNGSANITTATWGTARTVTIGSTGKLVDGSGNVSWTLAEIGAQAAGSYAAASHTHLWTDITNRPTNVSSFTNDSGYITSSASISGNAATATRLATARTLTIGNTGKTFDGSANVAWSLSEIGAQPAGSYAALSHTHDAADIASGTLSTARLSEFIDNKYTYQTNSYGNGGGVYMPMVKGGLYASSTSTITGRLRIKLPTYRTDMMISFIIDVYEYDTDRFTSYYVSGYNYSDAGATWYNTSAIALADSDNRNLYVRFGADTTNNFQCVSIGETDTSWTYPQVVIRDVMGGYSTATADMLNTWTIEFVTTDGVSYPHSHITNQPIVDWSRIVNAPSTFTPSSHTHDDRYYTEAEVGNFFSGATAITGYNKSNWDTAFGWGNHASQSYATQAYVNTAVANVVNSAPAALDTLNELAAALGNDASFSTTVSTALGNRLRVDTAAQGLTGTQQSNARTNLGLGSAATSNTGDFATSGHTHSAATTSVAGFMSAADKTKLDGIATGATANTGTVTSVSGTGSYGGLTLSGTVTSSGSLTLGGTPSGTWPISISGSAASATSSSSTYRGIIEDTRAAQRTPDAYDDYAVSWEFTNQMPHDSNWLSVMTMQGWHNGYAAWQIQGPATSSAPETWYLRSGINSTWNTARTIIHSGNIGSQSVNYATSAGSATSATTAGNVTGTVAIANGGTGSTTAAGARTNLGLGTAATSNTGDFATAGHSHSNATTGAAGFMSAADKSKLDGIASGATANSGTVTSVSGSGSVNGITLSGTVTSSGSLTLGGSVSIGIDNITDEHRLFNNMGDNHSTRTSFDATTPSYNFGWRFVQGSTNGPGTGGSQFYSLYVGLGNDYNATGAGSYGMQLAIDRNVSTPYLSVRYNEGNSLSSWRRINAGYADSAGSVAWTNVSSRPTALSQFTNDLGNYGGWQSASTAITTSNIGSQSVNYATTAGTANAVAWANVSGRPTAVSSFTNDSGYITSSGSISGSAGSVAWGNITGRPGWMASSSLIDSHSNANDWRNSGFYENAGGGSNWPSQTWYNSINVRHSNQGNYHGFQVAMSYYDNLLWFRSYQGSGTFQSWAYAISSQNIGSQSVNYATTAGSANSVAWSNVSGRPTNVSSFTNDMAYVTSGSSPTFQEVYANGWLRNNASNTGLYNQATTQHWSSRENGYWDASSTTSVSAIRFYTGGHVSSLRGYVYANTSNEIGFLNSAGSWSLRCDNSGNVTATGDVTAYSDARIKTNVATVENALDKVLQLRGVTYQRTDTEDKSTKVGLIAQEVKEVLPEVVTEQTDGLLSVSYGNMVGVLIEAMKEQQQIIETLEAKIELLSKYLK